MLGLGWKILGLLRSESPMGFWEFRSLITSLLSCWFQAERETDLGCSFPEMGENTLRSMLSLLLIIQLAGRFPLRALVTATCFSVFTVSVEHVQTSFSKLWPFQQIHFTTVLQVAGFYVSCHSPGQQGSCELLQRSVGSPATSDLILQEKMSAYLYSCCCCVKAWTHSPSATVWKC